MRVGDFLQLLLLCVLLLPGCWTLPCGDAVANTTFVLTRQDSDDWAQSPLTGCTVLHGSLHVAPTFNSSALSSVLPFTVIHGDVLLANISWVSTTMLAWLRKIDGTLFIQDNVNLVNVRLINLTDVGGIVIQNNPVLSFLGLCSLRNITSGVVNISDAPLLPCGGAEELFSRVSAPIDVALQITGGCHSSFECPYFCGTSCASRRRVEFALFVFAVYPLLIVFAIYQLMRIACYSCQSRTCKCNLLVWQHWLVLLNTVFRLVISAAYSQTGEREKLRVDKFFITFAIALSFSINIITFTYLIITWASLHHFAMTEAKPFARMRRFFMGISALSFLISVVMWFLMLQFFETEVADVVFKIELFMMGAVSSVFSFCILFYGVCLVRSLSKLKSVSGGKKRKKVGRLAGEESTSSSNSTSSSGPEEEVEAKPRSHCRYLCCCLFCFWNVNSTQRLLYGAVMFSGVFALMSVLLLATAQQTSYNRDLGYTNYSIAMEFLFWLSLVIMLWLFTAGVSALNPKLKQEEEERKKQQEEQEKEREREQAKREREQEKERRKKERELRTGGDSVSPEIGHTRSASQLTSASAANSRKESTVVTSRSSTASVSATVSTGLSRKPTASAVKPVPADQDIELGDAPRVSS